MIDHLFFHISVVARTTLRLCCSAGLLLLLMGCDNCEDCEPAMTSVYSVANRTNQPLVMIFYADPQLLAAGSERVEIAPETTVQLHETSTYQISGPVSFLPAESDGQQGSYDSLAIVFPTERVPLDYADCGDPRNALCIENYETSGSNRLTEYTLLINE